MNEELKDLSLKYLIDLRRNVWTKHEESFQISIAGKKYNIEFKISEIKRKVLKNENDKSKL